MRIDFDHRLQCKKKRQDTPNQMIKFVMIKTASAITGRTNGTVVYAYSESKLPWKFHEVMRQVWEAMSALCGSDSATYGHRLQK